MGLESVQGEGKEKGPSAEYSSHIEHLEFEDDTAPTAVDNGTPPTNPILILSATRVAYTGQMCPSQSRQRLMTRRFATAD